MNSKGFQYLTQTEDGIWYYQRWLPAHFRRTNPSLRKVFRVSLRTRDSRKVRRLSQILTVKIDELALTHFDDSAAFGKAMELLLRSTRLKLNDASFDEYEEHFLSSLDQYDDWLLNKAEHFKHQIEKQFLIVTEELDALKKALAEGGNNQELLAKITEVIHPEIPDDKNPTLQELLDQWKEKNANLRSFEGTSRAIELFVRFVYDYESGEVRTNQLSTEHIHYYQKYYSKIPVRVTALNYSIQELIKITGQPKSPKTITDNFSTIGSFLSWIAKKGYPIDGKLHIVLTKGSDIKLDPKLSKSRKPFTDEDLCKLFNSDEYLKTGAFETSGMYWAPLLALFTGAREAEILQLEKHDIYRDGRFWVIRIDDIDPESTDDLKHVKQDGSRRIVPIHKQLIKLGFLDYVKKQDTRIFPDEPRKARGNFDNFSKRFKTYRIRNGVVVTNPMEMKDFHSFRHTIETRLADQRYKGPRKSHYDQGIIDGIIGHASTKRSMGESTYTHTQFIEVKHSAIHRLDYPGIEFSDILSWEKCKFARKPYRERIRKRLKSAS